ncbi:hypothetical protein [Scytonema sp. PCC 10023]|uniref:hypothetical protein n=1 Tax=Scytonema sp. PCC 10023 TaxID=1680591 RepID=UPI0039C66B00
MEDGRLPGFSLEEIKVERLETRCKTKLNTGLTRQRRVRREAYTVPKVSVGTSLQTGMTVEQVARLTGLDVSQVEELGDR